MTAERLRRMVSAESGETDAGAISVTISLGVTELGAVVENPKAWIECADQALYAAKRGGRDQVMLYGPDI
jgi:diguanylate cyclase (GGDEF)-like protein